MFKNIPSDPSSHVFLWLRWSNLRLVSAPQPPVPVIHQFMSNMIEIFLFFCKDRCTVKFGILEHSSACISRWGGISLRNHFFLFFIDSCVLIIQCLWSLMSFFWVNFSINPEANVIDLFCLFFHLHFYKTVAWLLF